MLVPGHRTAVRRAFTLRELLIAVAIIMVLLAILIPSVVKARASARQAVCLGNVRQLALSFGAYAYDYKGVPVPANSAGVAGQFWAELLQPYSTKAGVTGGQKVLLNTLCPSATTLSNALGSVSAAWGPTTTPYGGNGLVVGNQYGGYGLNGSLYSNNPPPPMVNILPHKVGLIAATVNTSGNHSVIGDALVRGSVTLSGAAKITGQLSLGGMYIGSGAGSVVQVAPGSILMPDVPGFYNALSATPNLQVLGSVSNNATFDFNAHPVIKITGDADFSKVATVVGSGTVLVSGNVTKLPDSLLSFNIIALGMVNLKNGNLNGSIYCVGDAGGNGNGRINGCLVTMGQYNGNGGPDIYATSFPWFDQTYFRPGLVTTINTFNDDPQRIPVFGDSIWAEAWPSTGDVLTGVDPAKGDVNSGLGRYYIKRHSDGVDVSFLDGHAEYVPLANLRSLRWNNQF